MKILIVEDDQRIAKLLAEELKNQHYTSDIAKDGQEALDYAQMGDYELILLDLMLPKLDGISFCKKIRASTSSVLIFMLTAKDTPQDIIAGLDAGADDYLVKPFDLEVLTARIRALARRSPVIRPTILQYDDHLSLNLATCEVFYDQQLISLTPKEYELLEYFLKNPQQVFTRNRLLNKLWELDQSSGEETIRTHIGNLRKKLKSVGCSEEIIQTVYGIGYRLKSC